MVKYVILALALACSAPNAECDTASLAHLQEGTCGASAPWSDAYVPTFSAGGSPVLLQYCLDAAALTRVEYPAQGAAQDVVWCSPSDTADSYPLVYGSGYHVGAFAVQSPADVVALVRSYWEGV